jgi:hypothetical protein
MPGTQYVSIADFFSRVLSPVTLDLNSEAEQVVLPVTIVYQHDEVGDALSRFRAIAVRHSQAEVVVLDVGFHLWMRLGHAAKFGLP